jgi:peptide/nickel transport system permease protein
MLQRRAVNAVTDPTRRMLAFILRRLAQAFLVMLSVAFIAFMLFQYVGDPVASMLGQDATAEQREALRKDLGLDKPFVVQFAHFAGNALQGDFGLRACEYLG